ncbi:MAG: T9SS type A sorting domain-containing protein [bacterium]|nr:T9SS type A sorting domain-containing protein [bacterium]
MQAVILAAALLSACLAFGETHDVPSEYDRIQAALDVSSAGDTVRVAPGIYHEFLAGPAHNITLTGWHPADTLPEFRTTLDPIPAGPDTPSVAVFNGSILRVKNFAFYVGPELRPFTGGIEFGGDSLFVENCRFDTVSRGINGGWRVVVRNSIFNRCDGQCIRPEPYGSVDAEFCKFDGGSGDWLVRCYSGSSLRDCEFLCSENRTDLLSISGSDIEVLRCKFGPCMGGFPILRCNTEGNVVIEECLFESISRASSLIQVTMDCPPPEDIPVRIRRNLFRNYTGIPPAQGTVAIKLLCQDSQSGDFGIIDSNQFVDGFGRTAVGVYAIGSVELNSNTFAELAPSSAADVLAEERPYDTLIARGNRFLAPGLAASTLGAFFDATENWWGDSTGPYNANFNPDGLGTEVGNGVIFEPWLTFDPDSTSDTSGTASREPMTLLATEPMLAIYPNPFNNEFRLELTGFARGEFSVRLYDLLGRQVALLYSGRLAGPVISVTAPRALASGVYFVRAADARHSLARKVVLLK